MDGEEIKSKLRNLLDAYFLLKLENIGQKSYKDSFFELFREAYEGDHFDSSAKPRLTGDAIRDSFEETWISEIDVENQNKARELMNDFLRRWDEWHYAWSNK